MRKLQSQGVHHITLVGADRQTSIDFWEGVLGMPFVFEQPNGHTHAGGLLEAPRIRIDRGDYNIAPVHLADAIEQLVVRSRESLSEDRSAKDPYADSRPAAVKAPEE